MNRALAWLIAGIIYVVLPWDFDWVPLVGWVDDVLVLAVTVYYAVDALKRRIPRGARGPAAGGPRPSRAESNIPGDPYAILGLKRGASPMEIKAAFRKKIAEYHPDKVAHLGDELKSLAEEKAKAIQAAYEKLSA
jgi:uncharacterized membrane protein YkvA (DUF1232 family)